MKKCKWAGDAGDEYCKDCNGCELMFEGQKKIATDCAGYEPGDEDVELEGETEEKDLPMNPPEEVKEDKKASSKKKEQPKEEPLKNVIMKKGDVSKVILDDITTTNSKVKSIRIRSGVTREIDGTYYKFTYEQENELNPNLTPEQIEEEKAKIWDICNSEVDKQLADLVNN